MDHFTCHRSLLLAGVWLATNACDADAPSPRSGVPVPSDAGLSAEGGPGARGTGLGPWPEADRLFHQDPAWRGGDGAMSVALGGARVLWLFGDSFVARGETARARSECAMVRNSVAVQSGLDPSAATITFAHVRDAAGPRSFFREEGGRWAWPGHGVRLGDAVYVFLSSVEGTPGQGLGFRIAGWEVARLRGLDGPPETWSVDRLGTLPTAFGTIVGAAVVRDGGYVVATAVDEPGDHSIRLVRWAEPDLAGGALDRAEWWTGSAWAAQGSDRAPAVVATAVSTEMSLQKHPTTGEWLLVHSRAFGASDVVVRRATRLEGPYGPPGALFRPAESDGPRPFVYAGKAHPELLGAGLVVTYAANAFDFDELVANERLYYPRFVRVGL